MRTSAFICVVAVTAVLLSTGIDAKRALQGGISVEAGSLSVGIGSGSCTVSNACERISVLESRLEEQSGQIQALTSQVAALTPPPPAPPAPVDACAVVKDSLEAINDQVKRTGISVDNLRSSGTRPEADAVVEDFGKLAQMVAKARGDVAEAGAGDRQCEPDILVQAYVEGIFSTLTDVLDKLDDAVERQEIFSADSSLKPSLRSALTSLRSDFESYWPAIADISPSAVEAGVREKAPELDARLAESISKLEV